jgi:hypothetical protein
MATISISEKSSPCRAARNILRPILPKPLIPTLIDIESPFRREPSGLLNMLLKISPMMVLVKIFPKKDVDFIIEKTL